MSRFLKNEFNLDNEIKSKKLKSRNKNRDIKKSI